MGKKKIGIVSIWFRRGQTYVSLQVKKALELFGYEVHILGRKGAIGGKPMEDDRDELKVENYTSCPKYEVDAELFEKWVKDNRLDLVVFIEEQWQQKPMLGAICKKLSIPSINIIMWEFFNPDDRDFYNEFDRLVFPIKCGHEKALANGYPNSRYVKWGIDFNEWGLDKIIGEVKREKRKEVRFFHSSGWGGIYGRKQTELILRLFKSLDKQINAKLLIHIQNMDVEEKLVKESLAENITLLSGNIPRHNLMLLYGYSDFSINISKWEGLGLNFLESYAMGCPVLTIDAPPMNEWSESDFKCEIREKKSYDGICVDGVLVDENSFISNLEKLSASGMNESIEVEKRKVYEMAKKEYDWSKNSIQLINVVRELI